MVKKKRGKEKEIRCKPLTVVGLVALFILGLLALNLVSVGNGFDVTMTGQATKTSFISDLFTSWTAGDLDVNIAKYLFFGMLTLFIWGVLSYMKLPKQPAIQWLLAIPIAFLSMAYITPEEIFVVLTGFSALGLALTSLVPFIIMLFFSAMLLGNKRVQEMTVGKVMFQFVLWGFFVIFLIYKLLIGYVGVDRPNMMVFMLWIILILSASIFFFNKRYRAWIRGLGIELKASQADVTNAVINANAQVSGAANRAADTLTEASSRSGAWSDT